MRVGVLGCGAIARIHVAALRTIAGVEVTAVADVVPRRAHAFAAEHGIPHVFADVELMLAGGVDAVTVCTPHAAHEAGVLAAARHRVHVLCEKPLANDVAQAKRMIVAAEGAGIRFGAIFQRRFWPAAARIRAALDDGRLGPLISGGVVARLHRDAGYYAEPGRGGVLMTQVIHHIDLLQWWLGRARRVTGHRATLANDRSIGVEDTAGVLIEFASGAIATVQAGTTFRPGLGVQVWVSDAAGRTAGVTEYPEGVGFTDVWTVPGEPPPILRYEPGRTADLPLADVHDRLAPFHAVQIADFVAAVRDGREPAVTGRDAFHSLEIVEAVYASSRTGRTVELG
ncbi:Gfo/Idh/MocA family oxidoreductase [Actinoplanes hulinensis]|uniref:Gfo/Idh/MocA family oxidoreductase n=1 Tax=Actinoplanes hulinensis TaxID=1144547 RepID=A0ABS7B1T5_9ACTN|nr:Gfo/Idh/MocA family oxidoreductase [Actinoplanes hulinensis]MBW6434945.1 Gfo/Idh/MocA family oxidoreductase [Actinoplanes hulinensis]